MLLIDASISTERLAAVTSVLVLLGVCSGCATISAPAGWAPSAAEAQKEAYGSWAKVTVQPDSVQEESAVHGELIAVSDEFLYVLTYTPESPDGESLRSLSRSDVMEVRLERYDSATGMLVMWTIFGTLSTMSHGYYLAISAPIWMIAGGASVSRHSYHPIYTYPADAWDGLASFARFPQGLPAGIEKSVFRPKPRRYEGPPSAS